jgi:hypothetical protein
MERIILNVIGLLSTGSSVVRAVASGAGTDYWYYRSLTVTVSNFLACQLARYVRRL